MFQNGKCVHSVSILNEIRGQGWDTQIQIRPTTASVWANYQSPQPNLCGVLKLPPPSHVEPSLSAQQQALRTQLLSDGRTLMKGHDACSKPVSWSPPSGQCRAGPPLSYSHGRRQDLGVSPSRPPQDPIQGLGDTDQPSEVLTRKYGLLSNQEWLFRRGSWVLIHSCWIPAKARV